jgi:hypothetical protein
MSQLLALAAPHAFSLPSQQRAAVTAKLQNSHIPIALAKMVLNIRISDMHASALIRLDRVYLNQGQPDYLGGIIHTCG